MPDLTLWQWCLGGLAALLVGCAKTGVPGLGILVVPLMAAVFGGKASVGTLLPLLIVADCFAVAWYRRHAQWDRLWGLVPWVIPGLVLGAVGLWAVDELAAGAGRAWFKPAIGVIVLAMLGLHLMRRILGERLVPDRRVSVGVTGALAGMATTLANAAGPIMTLYLAGMRLPKAQFMGTNAWFFLLLNLSKVPIYLALSLMIPANPMITGASLLWNLSVMPLIVVGVIVGRWALPRIPQRLFDVLVLLLAAVAALHLILDPWL